MDDLYSGGDTIEKCKEQVDKIIRTLEAGKFPLTKWVSNDPAVLENVADNSKMDAFIEVKDENPTVKTLGLQYSQKEDAFSYKIRVPEKVTFTKRGLLSMAASIYDPIGWMLPVIMLLRMMIQGLWMQKLDWDDKIEETIVKKFQKIIDQLHRLREIRIPRWFGSSANAEMEIVGFSDASGDGCAAVVYSRIKMPNGILTRLIASKGRVTPLKTKANMDSKKYTIPKLELEALVLLADLYTEVKKSFAGLKCTFTAYTDSEIVLAWVRSANIQENKFVRARVAKIKKVIAPHTLHYVKSAENPADPGSRGLYPKMLVDCDLWFSGPYWLGDEKLPETPFSNEETNTYHTNAEEEDNLFERFSSWRPLLRGLAIAMRWKNKIRGPLRAEEIIEARKKAIRMQQGRTFDKEIRLLEAGKQIPAKHWLSTLNPWIDPETSLLRVGGRICHSKGLTDAQKHPILLSKSHLVDLIIRETHEKNGHSGVGHTERILREEFWIPALKSRVKKQTRACLTCKRWRAQTIQPQMADLPPERINEAKVFEHTGVDLCGPFQIRPSKIKFEKIIKVWVAVFICLATKAVHLEICRPIQGKLFGKLQ